MRKIWILVIAVIVFLGAYGVFPQVRNTVNNAAFAAGGTVATSFSGFWNTVSASPIYQQYHMLIWFVGGIVFLYAFQRLLMPRIPTFKKKAAEVYKPMGPPAAPIVSSYTPTTTANPTAQTVVTPTAETLEKEQAS